MAPSIHGHEVLERMLAAEGSFTLDSLEQAIHGWFGPDARFQTCSVDGMTARELIEFFASRGKLAGTPEAFGADRSQICDH